MVSVNIKKENSTMDENYVTFIRNYNEIHTSTKE